MVNILIFAISALRLVNWVPDVPTNMSWLYGLAGGIYNQAGKSEAEEYDR